MSKSGMLAPGATIGILGGGQLGRMSAMAAARLGYRCHVFAPEAESPAGDVAALHTRAAWDDEAALAAFADTVDVVTLEFENVPRAALDFLAARRPVRPGAGVLAVTQDRIAEKDFLRGIGIAVTDYRAIEGAGDLAAAIAEGRAPAILKTARFGYDGKGQCAIAPDTDARAAWASLGTDRAILEARVDFAREVSVIVARGVHGDIECFPLAENEHRDHILKRTTAPAAADPALVVAAEAIARTIATALDLVGLVAVEMFETADGRLLVNELAPRPHNSGHWTIDACAVSQFEQHIRAVAGLPLGRPMPFARAVMDNLIGHEADAWAEILAEPGARLHLYGKSETRAGRKMGHVTRLLPPDGA